MKKCLWLHDWVDVSVPINDGLAEKYKVPRFQDYRYCKRCERWQRFVKLPYNSKWYDCEKPILRPVVIAYQIPRD
jgi:hypothetical protein